MNEYPKTFGDAIRLYRDQRKTTRAQLAQESSVSLSYLAKMEQGKVPPPSVQTLDAVVRALDLSPSERRGLSVLAGHSSEEYGTFQPIVNESALAQPVLDLDALSSAPGVVLTPLLRPISRNTAHHEWYPNFDAYTTQPEWLFFETRARIVHEDWEEEARRVVWWLRQQAQQTYQSDGHQNDPELASLLERLGESFDFDRLWSDPGAPLPRQNTFCLRHYPTREVRKFQHLFMQNLAPVARTASYIYFALPAP